MLSDNVFTIVYEHFAHGAVAEFNATGTSPPHLFGVIVDPSGETVEGMVAVPDSLASSFFRDEHSKNLLPSFIRFLLSDDSPFTEITDAAGLQRLRLVVQVNEAWMARETHRAGEAVDLSAPRTPPSQRPERTEGIGVFVHTMDRTVFGFCPILEEPRRAEYRPLETGYTELVGLMSMNPQGADGVVH